MIDNDKLKAPGGTMPWSDETQAYDSTNPRAEEDLINITSQYLESYSPDVKIGYDDYKARALGTINMMGSLPPISDWQALDTHRYIITAQDGSWFNIRDNSPDTPPTSDLKKIMTGTNGEIREVTKAEFSYNKLKDAFILVAFERRYGWFNRYAIDPVPLQPVGPIVGTIPIAADGLKFTGYYKVDIYIETNEVESDGSTRAITANPQTLEISSNAEAYKKIDMSGNAGTDGPAPTYWFNNSVQGSAIIYVDDILCADRKINYRVGLSNGASSGLQGGYADIQYIGTKIGTNCN